MNVFYNYLCSRLVAVILAIVTYFCLKCVDQVENLKQNNQNSVQSSVNKHNFFTTTSTNVVY